MDTVIQSVTALAGCIEFELGAFSLQIVQPPLIEARTVDGVVTITSGDIHISSVVALANVLGSELESFTLQLVNTPLTETRTTGTVGFLIQPVGMIATYSFVADGSVLVLGGNRRILLDLSKPDKIKLKSPLNIQQPIKII
jgi:hypothetical protein